MGRLPLPHPFQKTLHAGALAPHQAEELDRAKIVGLVAEECFEAPLNVGRFPRAQAVALGDDPVVAKSDEHLRSPKRITSDKGWLRLTNQNQRIAGHSNGSSRRAADPEAFGGGFAEVDASRAVAGNGEGHAFVILALADAHARRRAQIFLLEE